MKMSKILVATGRGKQVRKMVRNQEEAYMEVWKLWAWKCMCSSGSCSWETKMTDWHDNHYSLSLIACWGILQPYMRGLPGSCSQTGTCRVPVQPYWVWKALAVGSLASASQTRRKPPLQASTGRTGTSVQFFSQWTCPTVQWKLLSLCICTNSWSEDRIITCMSRSPTMNVLPWQ